MTWLLAAAALLTLAVPLVVLYRPLGDYMAWVFTAPRHLRVERWIYRFLGVDPDRGQTWQAYLRSILAFSATGLVLLYALQRLQPWLPYSLGLPAVRPDTAFNTAASFVGNTNWQSYEPESTVGYTVQAAGLAVQSFVSAAVGLCVAITLVRGLAARRGDAVGNFWVDLIRCTLRLLGPLAVIVAVVFVAGGVVENLAGFTPVTTVDGGTQLIPGGPVASQEAIKMLGTNGGGFFGANSAHPFENPSAWTNLFQVYLLLVIPFALPRTFGAIVGDHRLAYTMLGAMVTLFVVAYAVMTWFEVAGGGSATRLAGAALEGKEQRIGVIGSTLFTTATTGTSGGAANSALGSYTTFGGLVAMCHMLVGEISPGGIGAGLYAMLNMLVISVFLAGLLLGRAPSLLGKRLGVREIVLASLFTLVLPVLSLGGLAISYAIPPVRAEILANSLGGAGPHGLSESLYAFISASVNNGSAFAGFAAGTPYLNTVLGVIILLGRFLPIALVLALAGAFARQDAVTTAADLPVHRPQFVGLLIGVILIVAVPTFFPLLAAGPLAEGLR
ncbi:MAG: potassium-transporting ATPase subunit KdpA [Actinomycetia bacterium]|nr:potassium-transporting ATPase subunit KdpA [Actinomycetes bacterium]